MKFTRRSMLFSAFSLAFPALGEGEPVRAIENPFLRFEVALDGKKLGSRRFTNRLSNQPASLPASDFELEFQDGTILSSASCSVHASAGADHIELLYSGPEYQVRVQYELPPGKPYLRKRMSVRATAASARRLLRVDLENWQGVHRPWNSFARLADSRPIYCDDIWAGVEFVAAFNSYGQDGFLLRSRPGGKRVGTDWLALRSTVVGVAKPGGVREAFYAYTDDIHQVPAPRYVQCYNSWYSLPRRFQRQEYMALIRSLKEQFYDRQGVFFDLVVTDAGWSDKHTIWEIDRQVFPQGFTPARAIVESAGGKLGMWMSPSETYPTNIDYQWALQNGYTVVEGTGLGVLAAGGGRSLGLSLADPKYRQQTIQHLQNIIVDSGLEHIKFDGLIRQETVAHDDLLPGDDSVEPIAEYALALVDATKQANPRLVTEPTYANSPWIIMHSDTVWGGTGDCPAGMCPAPDFRESHTNAREFRIFGSLNQIWLPQHSIQHFDIEHCDQDDGFPNHAAMAFGRGRFFMPCYINPKFMRYEDWAVYAGLVRWGRKNKDILYNTVILPSRLELGEPYVYAHWLGTRGILAVRNPSNETQPLVLDLGKAGAPAGLQDAVAYTQYPYRKGVAEGLDGRSTVPLKLAPWELLFIEVQARAELAEPVVIGARWSRDAQGRLLVAGEQGARTARLINPQGGGQEISLPTDTPEEPKVEILEHAVKKTDSAVEFQLEYGITSPLNASTQVLLLLEFPGRNYYPSDCRATINGTHVDSWSLNRRTSQDRIGEFSGNFPAGAPGRANVPRADTPSLDSHWIWYILETGPGISRVRYSGNAQFAETRVRAWAWTEWDLFEKVTAVDAACSEPAMPQVRAHIERRGIRMNPA